MGQCAFLRMLISITMTVEKEDAQVKREQASNQTDKLNSALLPISSVNQDKFCNLYKPQFPHQYNGDNNSCFTELLWRIEEVMYLRGLEQCLTYNGHLLTKGLVVLIKLKKEISIIIILHKCTDLVQLCHLLTKINQTHANREYVDENTRSHFKNATSQIQ